ncbi:MAG: peptide chain release factor 1 [Candidatus Schekmanbacteria bacterium]|nr:peptide chain release factor 1 [Candidatus Schekmanbacteria bacterium]
MELINGAVDRLEEIRGRFDAVVKELADPSIFSDQDRYRTLTQEFAALEDQVKLLDAYYALKRQVQEVAELVASAGADEELLALAREEQQQLATRQEKLNQEILAAVMPHDPNDDKNIILEIRAGTGGEEAALFAGELFRMYLRLAERRSWRVELLSQSDSEIKGGYKEVIANVTGKKVFGSLKYERGVHRVQRVPATESQGRIHTSAVTVAVLPEAEEVEVEISPEDLRIDVYRSSGPGGQSVNTTDSAVRITHIPSGLVVTCQDEKSQHKNRTKALKILRSRLYDRVLAEHEAKIALERRSQVGSGDRSAKIRTYNFPQTRVTDHRIKLTVHRLEAVLAGDLDELIAALALADQESELATQSEA